MKRPSEKNRLITVATWIIWLAPVVLFLWVVERHIVLSGKLEVHYRVGEGSSNVLNFASKEPDVVLGVAETPTFSAQYQLITQSPLYFDVRIPRPFPKATVRIVYANANNLSPLRLGVKQAGEAYYYKDLALDTSVLDNLPDHWSMMRDGARVLWQKDKSYAQEKLEKNAIAASRRRVIDEWKKNQIQQIHIEAGKRVRESSFSADEIRSYVESETARIENEYQDEVETIVAESTVTRDPIKTYATIDDFFTQLPNKNTIAQYNTQISDRFRFTTVSQSKSPTEITTSLRGSHEMYTYVGEGDEVSFSFLLQDANRDTGEDSVEIKLTDVRGKVHAELSYDDDGDSFASGVPAPEYTANLSHAGLPTGLYRVNIETSEDTIIKYIRTSQRLLTFTKKVFLAENTEYRQVLGEGPYTSPTLVTRSTKVSAITRHANGFQDISISSINQRDFLEVDQVKEVVTINDLNGDVHITVPTNDVEISGDGTFSFSPDSYFSLSDFLVSDLSTMQDVEKYDFIIAEYPEITTQGEWAVAEATVTAPQLYVDTQKDSLVHFIIDIPGVSPQSGTIKVREVHITFEKEPITINNALSKVKGYFEKIVQ